MKCIVGVLATMASIVSPHCATGQAMQSRVSSNCYVVIAATDTHVFLELRSDEHDQLIQDVVLDSLVYSPEYQAKDVVLDDNWEYLVRVAEGGTGLHEWHLKVYGVIDKQIRQLGDFVTERKLAYTPASLRGETLKGVVTFPRKNEIVYRYTQVVRQGGQTVTNSVCQKSLFDLRDCIFRMTESPNPTSDGFVANRAEPSR
jgi:hypothetical protein